MKNKGVMVYTMIGIVVIAMVAIVAIHLLRISYVPEIADEAEQDRFNNAIYDLHSQIPEIVSDSAYPMIWKAGHNMDSNGVNKYLNKSWTKEQGETELTKDLITGFTETLNQELCNRSNCTDKYVFDENGIKIAVYPLAEKDIAISHSEHGMSFNVTLHMNSQYKEHYYDNNFTMTTDVPTRLYSMYEKARDFDYSYENDVGIANTLALYARGIGNAYGACNGSLLNQGHFTYDPVDTFLRGNRQVLEELPKNPGDAVDLGAVPVATWIDETRFLTEPSYVPPSADIGDGIPVDLVKNTLINGFDVKEKMDEQCNRTLDNQTLVEECLKDNDPDELWDRYKALIIESERVHAALVEVDNWKTYANTGTDCDTFKDRTLGVIDKLAGLIKNESGATGVHDKGYENSQPDRNYETYYKPSLDEIKNQIQYLSKNITDLRNVQTGNLNSIGNSLCRQSVGDCYYNNTREYRNNCNSVLDKGDCTDCDPCSDECDSQECVGGEYHTCDNKHEDWRVFKANCTREVKSGEGENETYTDKPCNLGKCSVETCTCQCHPDYKTLIEPISEDVNYIYGVFKTYEDNLNQLSKEVRKRASDMQASVDMVNSINNTAFLQEGYDVKSQINYNYVRFSDGSVNRSWCYPSYSIKDAGVCGNKDLSITAYTIQVGVGALLALTVGCQPCLDFTYNTFPAMYTSEEVNYSINEKIVDDRNRVMLHNIFAGDEDLYGYNQTSKLFTHVAAEFVIYENKSIHTTSWAIIPMYFPLLAKRCETCNPKCTAWSRVTDALASDSCNTYKGVNSSTGGC